MCVHIFIFFSLFFLCSLLVVFIQFNCFMLTFSFCFELKFYHLFICDMTLSNAHIVQSSRFKNLSDTGHSYPYVSCPYCYSHSFNSTSIFLIMHPFMVTKWRNVQIIKCSFVHSFHFKFISFLCIW